MGTRLDSHPKYRWAYGVYTVGDWNFFPGVVASINSLRAHGYTGPVAVADVGFRSWMVTHLLRMQNVFILDIDYLRKVIRFTDCQSDEEPVMLNWGYKAFAILHFNLFETFTFIDADYLPLCNLEKELRPLAEAGEFVSTEDGVNHWDDRHRQAVDVTPGSKTNINAGFFTLSMRFFDWLVHEWRNLLTRRQPFGLWHGDQGALNAILDKYSVEKTAFDKLLWNQTGLNEAMHRNGEVGYQEGPVPSLVHLPTRHYFKGWHGFGWHKPWHCLGIDEYRSEPAERQQFYHECQEKVPRPVVRIFRHFLFAGNDGHRLKQVEHRILPS